jgi:hypothetical protein
MTEKRNKVTVDDIIGIVECEATDSVEEVKRLRGRETKTENIHQDCENYNNKKDMCLKWFEENVSERYKVCKEYSEFNDRNLQRKWSN